MDFIMDIDMMMEFTICMEIDFATAIAIVIVLTINITFNIAPANIYHIYTRSELPPATFCLRDTYLICAK